MSLPSDLAMLRRTGRTVAFQISIALAAVLLLVGAVVAAVYVRAQDTQITDELTEVARTADDVDDPPPGIELALRTNQGSVSTTDGGKAGLPLLNGPPGLVDTTFDGRQYRALIADRQEGRVIALMDLAPSRASRGRLLGALALAELTGILASIAVVVLLTRRSVRPLAQALALQRRFVADASHELRAPLTVLHTRAQLLSQLLSGGKVSSAAKHAGDIVDDTRLLSDVVDDLLASASLAAGNPGAGRIDVSAVAESVCHSMSHFAESIDVSLACSVQDGSEILGSETAIRRALTALVDNALGHTPEGGKVELRVSRDGQQVIVSVVDDGAGIRPDVIPTIFDRFAREGHGTQSKRTGRNSYGIGLALVREIVHAHGGDIRVESAPGHGSTFALSFPAASPDRGRANPG